MFFGRAAVLPIARLQLRAPRSQLLLLSKVTKYNAASSSSLALGQQPQFHIDDKIQQALSNQQPVVALESTIVAHGMPYPQNLELAKKVENILREKGVTPATIAVLDGVCRVGIGLEELEDLALSGADGRATKCSSRDLPIIMSSSSNNQSISSNKNETNQWGATTVASTMVLAHIAGISTFVTGGIGGVHRNGHVSLDVSADLAELARTPVVVVSAGIKSILDIGRTLEVLETLGVPTISYGAEEFPAFFSANSGIQAPVNISDPAQIARAYWASRALNMSHGMLVAVPNKDPAGDNVEQAIHKALAKAESHGILGRDVTPFVLKEVAKETGGGSLQSNMGLVQQNAHVGADIATAIALHGNEFAYKERVTVSQKAPAIFADKGVFSSRVLVMGGAVIDVISRPQEGNTLITGTSNPCIVTESEGGVGRNVAEALGLLGSNPVLFSVVGNDSMGQSLLTRMQKDGYVQGFEQSIDIVDGLQTATYLAMLNECGDLYIAAADMEILTKIKPPPADAFRHAEIIVMDANPPMDVLLRTAKMALNASVQVCFEPTSVPKARTVAHNKEFLSCLKYAFPNEDELLSMTDSRGDTHEGVLQDGFKAVIKVAATELLGKMHPAEAHVVVSLGERGVVLASKRGMGAEPHFTHFPVSQHNSQVENCTGAGDSLCGAFIHALLEGKDESYAVVFGMKAAAASLKCRAGAISQTLREIK